MIDVYYLDLLKSSPTPQIGAYTAFKGFQTMGAMCIQVKNASEINDTNPENIAIGGIGFVEQRVAQLGLTINKIEDYPFQLRSYLGREVWQSTINKVVVEIPKCFIKPVDKQKFFTGLVIEGIESFQSKGLQGEDYAIWCSEIINPIAEFRVFVRYGKILDVRRYKGDFTITPNYQIIQQAIKDFTDSPKAYGIDFCVDDKGRTLLVECNDGYALGDYGLNFIKYAKLTYTRWSEIVGCKDWYNF